MKEEIEWWTTDMKVPKIGQIVLIQHEYGNRTLSVARWDGECFVNLSDRWLLESYECEEIPVIYSSVSVVLAWMPIPEPRAKILDDEDDE